MIPFNRPPYTGNEDQYVLAAMHSDKISGDGEDIHFQRLGIVIPKKPGRVTHALIDGDTLTCDIRCTHFDTPLYCWKKIGSRPTSSRRDKASACGRIVVWFRRKWTCGVVQKKRI